VGIVLGALLGFAWIFVLDRFQKQKFTYVLTLALVLITYSVDSQLGGNGILAVLVFGIILGNYYIVNRLFRRQINIDSLQKQLGGFHEEISFLMKTLFFVFLGLTFVVTPSLVATNLSLGILFLVVLLAVRYAATRVSTYKSELYNERRAILFHVVYSLVLYGLAYYGKRHLLTHLTEPRKILHVVGKGCVIFGPQKDFSNSVAVHSSLDKEPYIHAPAVWRAIFK
jgi:NhaP-type Na+/H+ or K+/H+ antiporter